MPLKTLRLFWMLIAAPALAAAGPDDRLEIIELQFRPAAEILPLIEPFLAPDDAVTGTGYKLLVRTDPKTLSEIRRMVDTLDRAPQDLLVSVRHRRDRNERRGEVSVSGRVETGTDSEIVVGQRVTEGVTIQGGVADGNSRDDAEFRVRAVDGQPAYIDTGQVLYAPRIVYGPGGHAVVSGGPVEARRGFFVMPRVRGQSVTVDILPSADTLSGTRHRAVVDVNRVVSTVSGPVGEWIALGGVSRQASARETGTVFHRQGADHTISSFEVRVDVVR